MTADKNEKKDNSRKFVLRGGPFNGMKVRVYPEMGYSDSGVRQIDHWEGLTLDGEQYAHPSSANQDARKPYLLHQQEG